MLCFKETYFLIGEVMNFGSKRPGQIDVHRLSITKYPWYALIINWIYLVFKKTIMMTQTKKFTINVIRI